MKFVAICYTEDDISQEDSLKRHPPPELGSLSLEETVATKNIFQMFDNQLFLEDLELSLCPLTLEVARQR